MTALRELATAVREYGECSDTVHLLPMIRMADEILDTPQLEASETVVAIRDFARHQKHAECEILIGGWADELEAAERRIAELESERDRKKSLNDELVAHTLKLQAKIAGLEARLASETEIVDRIWRLLGITSYEAAKGKTIFEILEAQLAPAEIDREELARIIGWAIREHQGKSIADAAEAVITAYEQSRQGRGKDGV